MNFKVKIKYLNENCKLEKHGNCYDVKSAKNLRIIKGNKALIPLGFTTEMDKSLRATVIPRSSSFSSWGFIQTNSIGEIEWDYGGEWKLPAFFLAKGMETEIKEGQRVGQIRFTLKEDASFWNKIKFLFCKIKVIEVEETKSTRKGFGSTGK